MGSNPFARTTTASQAHMDVHPLGMRKVHGFKSLDWLHHPSARLAWAFIRHRCCFNADGGTKVSPCGARVARAAHNGLDSVRL